MFATKMKKMTGGGNIQLDLTMARDRLIELRFLPDLSADAMKWGEMGWELDQAGVEVG